jgi:hypothetical protein
MKFANGKKRPGWGEHVSKTGLETSPSQVFAQRKS